MPVIFVGGTDTEIGKTWVTCRLLAALRGQGLSCVGYKPVAAGCEWRDGQWLNDDALRLQAASSVSRPYAEINPIALPEPIAPHLAAARAGQIIDPERMVAGAVHLQQYADWVLVEGAGGLRVPLTTSEDLLDVVQRAGWPVVLVVGMRLGCLNHALLSAQALQAAGVAWSWVANVLPPVQPHVQDNIATLVQRMPAPCLELEPALAVAGLQNLGTRATSRNQSPGT